MNPTPDNPLPSGTVPAPAAFPASFDETLRLIARAPVPAGLKERVHTALMEAAPRQAGRARILAWPASMDHSMLWTGSGWMRAAAAAAIVFVVAGGGWGVYQRVERPAARVIVIPAAQPATSGAFSSAGAIRTPKTVKGPMLMQPAAKAARVKARKKSPAGRPAPAPAPVSGATAQTVSAPAAAAAGK